MAVKNSMKATAVGYEKSAFKQVLDQQRTTMKPAQNAEISLKEPKGLSIKKGFSYMINNHELATKSLKTFMTRTTYSPEQLLAVQYKTGVLLLREQMFCKTAELSANTFKNFTQMQI